MSHPSILDPLFFKGMYPYPPLQSKSYSPIRSPPPPLTFCHMGISLHLFLLVFRYMANTWYVPCEPADVAVLLLHLVVGDQEQGLLGRLSGANNARSSIYIFTRRQDNVRAWVRKYVYLETPNRNDLQAGYIHTLIILVPLLRRRAGVVIHAGCCLLKSGRMGTVGHSSLLAAW